MTPEVQLARIERLRVNRQFYIDHEIDFDTLLKAEEQYLAELLDQQNALIPPLDPRRFN
jgi:hypothetical protein